MITSIALYAILLSIPLYLNKGTIIQRLGFKDNIEIKRETAIALIFIVALLIASIIVSLVFYQLGMHEDVQRTAEVLKQIPLYQVLIVLLIGSFVEEVFFRGFLQKRTNLWIASILFALSHIIYLSFTQVVGTLALGLLLGYQYEKTGGVYSPILSHTFYNLIAVTAMYLTI